MRDKAKQKEETTEQKGETKNRTFVKGKRKEVHENKCILEKQLND